MLYTIEMGLTEDSPLIKAYDENRAQTPETNESIELSLDLIEALHKKWCTLLWRKLPQSELKKYFASANSEASNIAKHMAMYAWHKRSSSSAHYQFETIRLVILKECAPQIHIAGLLSSWMLILKPFTRLLSGQFMAEPM